MITALKICSVPYKVKWYDTSPICPDDNEACDAYTSSVHREAGFIKNQQPEALLSDMIHECLHTVHPSWDEKEVNFISAIIASFLIENNLANLDPLS